MTKRNPNLRGIGRTSVRYNRAACRYVAASGQFLKPEVARGIVEEDLKATRTRLLDLGKPVREAAQKLQDGEISAADYEAVVDGFAGKMRDEVKWLHLANVAAAKGGIAQMDQAAFGFAGRQLAKVHYPALESYVAELRENPAIALDDATGKQSFEKRQGNYADVGLHTFEWARQKENVAQGFIYCENEEEPTAHHCKGPNSCPAQTAKGRVHYSKMLRIGARACGPFKCRCNVNYFREHSTDA
jgi:hypothetical protein